jgi:hypothetical protein
MLADTPATKRTFNMFAPMTLPTASSPWPLRTAVTAVTNSGNDVPKATAQRDNQ